MGDPQKARALACHLILTLVYFPHPRSRGAPGSQDPPPPKVPSIAPPPRLAAATEADRSAASARGGGVDFPGAQWEGRATRGDLGVCAARRWMWRSRCPPGKKALGKTFPLPDFREGRVGDRCLSEVRNGIQEGSEMGAWVG